MTNMYANGVPGGAPGAPGPFPPGPVAPAPAPPRRAGRPWRQAAALVVACAVVAGAAFAVTEAVSGPGRGTPAGQAAALSGLLSDASSASSAAAATPAQPDAAARQAALRRLRRALARLRLLGGMHGEYTFQTRSGPRTLAFERGAITKVSGADVTVRASDGTTWTWVLAGGSVVRENGSRVPAAKLAAGQQVFAGGQVSGSAHDARLVVIRPAGTARR